MNKSTNAGIFQLTKRLMENSGLKRKGDEIGVKKDESHDPVYLKDILREFKGKLYVPEEVFKIDLSEEEEFERNLVELPKMSFDDFQKALKNDKIRLLTSKSVSVTDFGLRDFIVDLKEIPGDKKLQKTKWAIKLSDSQAREVLEEYTGAQYEIEKHHSVINNYLFTLFSILS